MVLFGIQSLGCFRKFARTEAVTFAVSILDLTAVRAAAIAMRLAGLRERLAP